METASPAPGAKKILVVDDNKLILKSMSFLLAAKGYFVMTAETGAEALGHLRKDQPDLILLDLDFPPDAGNVCGTMRDGFTILDWARRMCDADKIPVIIISALDPEKYKDRAKAHGIPTYFRKPVDKEKLVEAIHGMFGGAPASDVTPSAVPG
jgi:CheY-like chemotaxis protein